MSTLTLVAESRAPIEFVQVSQFVFCANLSGADCIRFLTVFFNPNKETLPQGVALGVTLQMAEKEIFLGSLTNEMPSQIFRINFIPDNTGFDARVIVAMNDVNMLPESHNIPESLSFTQQNIAHKIGQNILKRFENFVNGCEPVMYNNEEFVSLKKLSWWFQNFDKKITTNKRFWDDIF